MKQFAHSSQTDVKCTDKCKYNILESRWLREYLQTKQLREDLTLPIRHIMLSGNMEARRYYTNGRPY
jgi:hypothetical protein